MKVIDDTDKAVKDIKAAVREWEDWDFTVMDEDEIYHYAANFFSFIEDVISDVRDEHNLNVPFQKFRG